MKKHKNRAILNKIYSYFIVCLIMNELFLLFSIISVNTLSKGNFLFEDYEERYVICEGIEVEGFNHFAYKYVPDAKSYEGDIKAIDCNTIDAIFANRHKVFINKETEEIILDTTSYFIFYIVYLVTILILDIIAMIKVGGLFETNS